jgi:hypothetical protein
LQRPGWLSQPELQCLLNLWLIVSSIGGICKIPVAFWPKIILKFLITNYLQRSSAVTHPAQTTDFLFFDGLAPPPEL